MSGGGSQQQSQTSTAQLSPEQQQLLSAGMPGALSYAAKGGVTLPGSPIAGFNQNQTLGQNLALGATGAQAGNVGSANIGNEFFTSGAALDPARNPALQKVIQATNLPIQQNFEEQVLPSIGRDAVGAGGYGGSRQGIAEGLAARGEQQAIGSADANIENANYQNALDQMTKNIAIAPSVASAQTIPALTTSGVGDVQQALQQAENTYGWQANVFQQEQPISVAEQLMGLAAGIPGGSVTTTGNVQNNPSALQTAGGLAGIGSALFGGQNGIFPGAGASFGSALSGLGSSIGSGLGSIFSGAAGAGSSLADLLPLLAMG
jgi:hypothetical protein